MKAKLIKATTEDVASVLNIAKSTFYYAFKDKNTKEAMDSYMSETFTEENIREELKNPNSMVFLCNVSGKIVGYLKLNFLDAQTEAMSNDAMEIQRIYVLPEYKGHKLGKYMMEHAISIAKDKNLKEIWLGVWELNPEAIQFYMRYGFEKFGSHDFVMGDEVQTDFLYRLML